MRTTLTLIIAILLLATGPAANARPPHRAPSGVIAQGSTHVTGTLMVIETATGLEPGRILEQTFEFTPTFSLFPRCFGGNAQPVDDNGRAYAFDLLAFLDPSGETGTLKGWWREPGSGCNGDPIMLDDGPAEITLSIP